MNSVSYAVGISGSSIFPTSSCVNNQSKGCGGQWGQNETTNATVATTGRGGRGGIARSCHSFELQVNKYQQPKKLNNNTSKPINNNWGVFHLVTKVKVLLYGLRKIGFCSKQQNVRSRSNNARFCSVYGVGPKAVGALVNDLKTSGYLALSLNDMLMAMNWLACYQTDRQNARLWKYNKTTVAYKVKEHVRKIQSL